MPFYHLNPGITERRVVLRAATRISLKERVLLFRVRGEGIINNLMGTWEAGETERGHGGESQQEAGALL